MLTIERKNRVPWSSAKTVSAISAISAQLSSDGKNSMVEEVSLGCDASRLIRVIVG